MTRVYRESNNLGSLAFLRRAGVSFLSADADLFQERLD
jgi:hypothetical protein